MNMFNLVLGNVGDVEVVLCRHSEALVLTRKFVTQEDPTECERVQQSDGIITEVSLSECISILTIMVISHVIIFNIVVIIIIIV